MSERGPIQDVNIELGDDVSKMLYEASKATYENRPGLLVEFHESFTGFRAIPGSILKDIGRLYMNMGLDGTGTKIEVAERLEDHSTIAHDLFAMVCDDAVVRGAEPVAVGSIFDVRQLDDTEATKLAIEQVATGYVEAAKAANVVVVNGETAELGDRVSGYGDFNYNWGAAAFWFVHEERILTGHEMEEGDTLVGFAEHGFRSNGITDVRKGMLERYGPEWHNEVVSELGSVSLGRQVLKPSIIYSGVVNELTGGYDISKKRRANVTGVAHITGGGQPSKLGRMLEPSGLGVDIDDPIEPPAIMKEMQNIRDFDDRTAYGKWHMGPGMIIATSEPEKVIAVAEEKGVDAKAIGHVSDKPGIRIKNAGAKQQEEILEF